MTNIEVLFNSVDETPKSLQYAEAAKRGALAALRFEEADGEIGIELTTDEVIHACNLAYRHVDRPTDVLSFPLDEGEELIGIPDGHLGDIMISVETAARQAEELGHSVEREVLFLAIHGTLHILGYDHMVPEDEEIMLKKQREILKITEA